MEGIRIEDVQNSEPGKFRVGVLARGHGPLFPGPNPFEPETGIAGIGTEATITGVTKLPNGQIGLLLKGKRRFQVRSIDFDGLRPMASIDWLPQVDIKMEPETRASIRLIRNLVFDLIKNSPLASQESLTLVQSTDDPLILANLLIPFLTLTIEERQELLEIIEPAELITRVTTLLIKEKELLDLSLSIHFLTIIVAFHAFHLQEMGPSQLEHSSCKQENNLQSSFFSSLMP
jgi:ATP-dependent Lon protease